MFETTKTLTTHDALILHQLSELGEDQLDHMSAELRENPKHLLARLNTLKKKGMVKMRSQYDEIIISLTNKGSQTIRYIWPEMQGSLTF